MITRYRRMFIATLVMISSLGATMTSSYADTCSCTAAGGVSASKTCDKGDACCICVAYVMGVSCCRVPESTCAHSC